MTQRAAHPGEPAASGTGSVLLKVAAFSLSLTLVFTIVANTLPQIEGEAPVDTEIELDTLTMDAFVALGESVFTGKGTCTLCHNARGRAPDLLAMNVVETARERLADERYAGAARDVEAYLRESMVEPGAYVVAGYGKKGTKDAESPMPAVDRPPISLSAVEMDAVIAFMQAKDANDVTVALPAEGAAPAEGPAPADGIEPPVASSPASTAEEAAAKYACTACHAMMGTESALGPPLDGVGARLDREEIRRSILDPEAAIAEGYPAGVMPSDFAERMTVSELELLVSWLAAQK